MLSTLGEHYVEGGFAMHIIALFLLLSIAIIVERVVYLYKCSINADAFIATLQKCILAGDLARAIKLCSAQDAPLSRIIKAGLMKVNRSDKEVQAAMDEAALKELPLIEHRTPYLGLLANLTMLCGLFGTVVGLIGAFGAVGSGADAATKALVLAAGISEAMNCTAFGLLSAITALIGFALINGKTQSLLDEINSATVQVMNLVVNNRSKINLSGAEADAA